MKLSHKAISLLAALASLVNAIPAPSGEPHPSEPVGNATVNRHALSQGWATFCTDTKCSEGCGISVSINNPGCLKEPNARSVKIHSGIPFDMFSLVVSPGDSCRCQRNCFGYISGNSNKCINLEGADGDSYRFVTDNDGCDEEDNVC